MHRVLIGTILAGVCLGVIPGVAGARPNYKPVFIKTYDLKPESALAKASCGACHMGADKKVRNTYGKELEKVMGKPALSDAEFAAALKKVEEKEVKVKIIDLIKADKSPGDAKPADAK